MRGKQRGEISIIAAEEHRGARVICLRETESAVAARNFDAERAELRKIIDYFLRNFAGAVDFIRIDFLFQKGFQPLDESVALVAILGALLGKGKNLRRVKSAHEQVGSKAGFASGGVSRR